MSDDIRMSALVDSVGGVADSLGVPEPESPGRLAHLWDVAAPWIVGVLAVIAFLAILSTTVLATLDLNSQNNHHAATVKSDAEIVGLLHTVHQAQIDNHGTLTEIKSLATAVNNVIAGLPAADTYLGKLALGLETQITALCSATHAACPSLSTAAP